MGDEDPKKLGNYLASFVDEASSVGGLSQARVGPCPSYESLKTVSEVLFGISALSSVKSDAELDAKIVEATERKAVIMELIRCTKKAGKEIESANKAYTKSLEQDAKKTQKAAAAKEKKAQEKAEKAAAKSLGASLGAGGNSEEKTSYSLLQSFIGGDVDKFLAARFKFGEVPLEAFDQPFLVTNVCCGVLFSMARYCDVCKAAILPVLMQ